MIASVGYAARSATEPLSKWNYELREPSDDELVLKVLYCGICHSDIHTVREEWGPASFPLVPGHEFVGEIVKMGKTTAADGFALGERIGVGCMVASCKSCDSCKTHWENHCSKLIYTYGCKGPDGKTTQGGYGQFAVLNKDFAIRIPKDVDIKDAAPLLCAGITVYSPIMQHGMGKGGKTIGVLGLGGLGHMAVQYAAKMGNEVIVISRSDAKKELAKKLGATDLVAMGDCKMENGVPVNVPAAATALAGKLDFILDTITVAAKPLPVFMDMLKPKGTLIMLALPPVTDTLPLPAFGLIVGNKSIAGSCIGGIKETQEMIDYSFKHNVMPMTEHIKADKVNEAYTRVVKGDVHFRFVIDVAESYN